MTFSPAPVDVVAPATSANLGPGFDALGLALALHDHLTALVTTGGLHVEVEGIGAQALARDETHLVVRSMRAAFDRLGVRPPGLRLHCRNTIPHGRGLGSSAAAIVSGIVAARALVAGGDAALSDGEALALAASIEGHPDNVAACLLGGLAIAWTQDEKGRAIRRDTTVRTVLLVPEQPVPTEVARALLPPTVPHHAAAATAGRAALLVAAMTAPEPSRDLLFAATQEWLHQEQRRSAMPATWSLLEQLRADALPAVVSGAGPSVLVLLPGGPDGAAVSQVRRRTPHGWSCHVLGVDPQGARVVAGMTYGAPALAGT
ncbi:MAG: homoserine kinase [Actinomycetota bacterium]|nr:homoserine kinase [Actinomycetota bacterium]